MSFTENNEEIELVQKYERALADLKKDYIDRRINPDIKQERANIHSEYMRLIMENDNIKQNEKINAESKRKGFEDKFLNNPEFGYYGREHVDTNMKKLTHLIETKHLNARKELTRIYQQSLRGIDEGIDPYRNIEYEGKKKEIEWNEEIRNCIKTRLLMVKREHEWKAQAKQAAETNRRSRNTFPGDWASGHSYGP